MEVEMSARLVALDDPVRGHLDSHRLLAGHVAGRKGTAFSATSSLARSSSLLR